MPDASEWTRKYSIELDRDQRKLIALYGNVHYCDGAEFYHNSMHRLRVRRSSGSLTVGGTWFGRDWKKYEDKEIIVPIGKIKFNGIRRYESNPGFMHIYTQGGTMTAQELACRTGWSVRKVRRVAHRTYGPLSLKQEEFFVEKRRYKGNAKKHEFFVGTNRTMKAVALNRSFEGEVRSDDVRVLSYVRSATDELLDEYGKEQPWRPTFHPKEIKRDLKMPMRAVKRSLVDLTGLLCFVIDTPRFSLCERSRMTSLWMLPRARDGLVNEIIGEAREEGLVVYEP